MPKFKLVSDFSPTGDQPQAIEQLTQGTKTGLKHQVLLGTTGSGKTFTIANVIQNIQKPVLVISHNKTLAAQLYQEYRDFFPENAVEYFVSYYDYYQPEAYIPQTDTYISKDANINEFIDKLRLSTTTSLMTRNDVIVIASVSCIYNLGSPIEYAARIIEIAQGMKLRREDIIKRLTNLHYQRNDYDFRRATFRTRGNVLDIWPAYADFALRLEIMENKLLNLSKFDPLTGQTIENLKTSSIYPAKHYLTADERRETAILNIRTDLTKRVSKLRKENRELEAYRLEQRTNYDLELISEIGYCTGIENYSRYFDGRTPGEPPYTLLNFFTAEHKDFLVIIDESHMTIPQVRGMYLGDKARKETLIDYGFRLPSALDNRPLQFEEFLKHVPQIIHTTATPGEWEIEQSRNSALQCAIKNHATKPDSKNSRPKVRYYKQTTGIVEQLIRPTGLLDPKIEVRGTKTQIENLVDEIIQTTKSSERTLVTTLTKRLAEDLSHYLVEQGVKACYLHSDIDTLDRSDILEDLRKGKYDVIVGINLLREGLDLPEVSLVAILDADKEGFLRSPTSLIQVMGRAARHVNGRVIMYADSVTNSMQIAIDEVRRRRKIQDDYNREHNIVPQTIIKPIREKLIKRDPSTSSGQNPTAVSDETLAAFLLKDKEAAVVELEQQMLDAARNLEFEKAAFLRDKIQSFDH